MIIYATLRLKVTVTHDEGCKVSLAVVVIHSPLFCCQWLAFDFFRLLWVFPSVPELPHSTTNHKPEPTMDKWCGTVFDYSLWFPVSKCTPHCGTLKGDDFGDSDKFPRAEITIECMREGERPVRNAHWPTSSWSPVLWSSAPFKLLQQDLLCLQSCETKSTCFYYWIACLRYFIIVIKHCYSRITLIIQEKNIHNNLTKQYISSFEAY